MTTKSKKSAFDKNPVPFTVMGEKFVYKFMPNIRLCMIVSKVFELALKVDVDRTEKIVMPRQGVKASEVMGIVNDLLLTDIYTILSDVLEHQNDRQVTPEDLMNKTSALEMAEFVGVILADEEIPEAVERLITGLGKLTKRLGSKIPSQMGSFMQSFSPSSESPPIG